MKSYLCHLMGVQAKFSGLVKNVCGSVDWKEKFLLQLRPEGKTKCKKKLTSDGQAQPIYYCTAFYYTPYCHTTLQNTKSKFFFFFKWAACCAKSSASTMNLQVCKNSIFCGDPTIIISTAWNDTVKTASLSSSTLLVMHTVQCTLNTVVEPASRLRCTKI